MNRKKLFGIKFDVQFPLHITLNITNCESFLIEHHKSDVTGRHRTTLLK